MRFGEELTGEEELVAVMPSPNHVLTHAARAAAKRRALVRVSDARPARLRSKPNQDDRC